MNGLHRVEVGAGATLLCLHGIGSSSASMQPQLDGLGGTHRVVAWDAPGYGKSADPESDLTLASYAAAAADLIEELGGEPAHLLGASWGGAIAMQVALDHPKLVRSLILVGASRGSGRDETRAAAMYARVAELERVGPAAFAAARTDRLLSADASDELRATVRATMEGVRLPGYRSAAQSMAETDLTPRLKEITAPTLVVVGDADGVTGVAESQALAEHIPDAVLVTVRGAGHVVNQERADAVNAWVASYLQIVEHLYPIRKDQT